MFNKLTVVAELCQNHNGDISILKEMIHAAKESGIKIFELTRVKKVIKGSTVRVETTNNKSVSSRFLVLACNGYLGNLEPAVASRVMPINNFIIATEPLGKTFGELSIIEKNKISHRGNAIRNLIDSLKKHAPEFYNQRNKEMA